MPKSIAEINKYLNYEFRNTALPATTGNFYINLSKTALTDLGTGATIPNGDNYGEVILAKTEENWTMPYDGEVTNSVIVAFPSGSAVSSGDWGTIMAVTLSHTSAGSPVYFYNLPTSVEVSLGGKITFEGGSLKFKRIKRGE